MLNNKYLALTALLLMVSCKSGPPPKAEVPMPQEPKIVVETKFIDTGCNWTKPFTYTLDQAKAIPTPVLKQMVEHNEMGAKKCGWKPPGKATPAKPASE
ncbi:Rz-like spanin [Burkholderia phage BcepNazgul]|uniref:Uncharacterized protein n=1 Tax=Burkholderia phage BcepNazgul TaxID=242861 RepID=Q2HPF3_9CAUD|nr:Rz-like spanin [Burkholderia phage BcepNazgul]ABD46774.1 hypothetical protein Rz1 [Burkholderia phage BcepNazgul]